MPTFENRESLSSVRQKLNDAILLAEATSVDLETEKGLAQLAAAQAQGYANAAQAAATAAEAVDIDVDAAIAAAGQAAISAAEAGNSATGAATSASISSTKALEAAASATLADTLATQAGASASSANIFASQAANSASLAEGYMSGSEGYSNNASNQASIATAQASLATTKAFEASNSAAQSANSALDASSFAETATVQAGISTTKANEAASSAITASTQAGISTSKASEAASSTLAAVSARDQSQSYAAAALASADMAESSAGSASSFAASAMSSASTATAKASEASASKDLSQAWAEGTLPGGAGTKSSREWAEAAEASADRVDLGALDAAVAAAQAAAATIPAPAGNALKYSRVNAAETAYEARTPAQVLVDIGAAASGVNNDITSLSGLTTPLSVAQGGTGANSAASALSNLGLTVPASVINRGPDQENHIINGAFDFWQRGTSHNVPGYGSADRWFMSFTGGAFSLTKVNETLGVLLGANNPGSFARLSVSGQTLSNHFAYIQQAIEGVRSYAGQTITVLGWARRVSGAGNMAVAMYQVFGTGGSPSPSVSGVGQQVALSSNWAPFAVTFNVPSVSGKTLGTDGNDYALLRFFASAGSGVVGADGASLGLQTIGVDLWGIHIRIGTHTTAACDAYRAPEFAAELARCQRYYETGPVFMTTYQGAASGFGYARPIYPKRVPPAVTFSGASYINASGLTALSVGTRHVTVTAVATAAGAVNYNATAAFDAEL